jgi:hypothetical protein
MNIRIKEYNDKKKINNGIKVFKDKHQFKKIITSDVIEMSEYISKIKKIPLPNSKRIFNTDLIVIQIILIK